MAAAGAPRRPSPTGLPLRVLVMGSSTVVYASWMGGPRHELTYPRVLEGALREAGFEVEVRVAAAVAERARQALRTWHRHVVPWSPDVVVLHYGHADSIHLFLPRWLERHANTLGKKRGPLRTPYRRFVLRPLWIGLANVQLRVDGRVGRWLTLRRSTKVANDLEELVERVRFVNRPLVLLPEMHQMGAQYQRWFPGVEPRMQRLNELVAELVARMDEPDVRVAPVRALLDEVIADGRDPVPDGSHLTPEVHAALGRALGETIAEWARTQPHLTP